ERKPLGSADAARFRLREGGGQPFVVERAFARAALGVHHNELTRSAGQVVAIPETGVLMKPSWRDSSLEYEPFALSWTGPALWRVLLEPRISGRRCKFLIVEAGGFGERIDGLIRRGGPRKTTAPVGQQQADRETRAISRLGHGWQTPGVAVISLRKFSPNARL